MARIPDAFIDDLLARTDLVEVIGARVPLKRQGREYSARCPFHDERSPSFTVSPTKQFYHCFGCGAHGTAISFLMNYDRLEFLDAVEELAKRAGMEVPRDTQARNENSDGKRPVRGARGGGALLPASSSRPATRRGRTSTSAASTPRTARVSRSATRPMPSTRCKNALGTDERRMALLEKTGMFSRSDSGRVYDKFRDRVMFPIHDRRGRVIAFGGRVLDKEDGPKYLNSPETPLFHKGRELYGLWQVRQAHAKIPRLIVVEGYMDVVALFQYGVTPGGGHARHRDHARPRGTAVPQRRRRVLLLRRRRAGRGAAWKAVESVLPRMRDGRQAFFLFLPEGEDPDSIVRNEGSAGFDARLAAATSLSEFFFAELSQGRQPRRRSKARRAWPSGRNRYVANIPDGAFRDLMQQRVTELTGVGARAPAPEPPAARTPSMRPRAAPRRRSAAWCAPRSRCCCSSRRWRRPSSRRTCSTRCASRASRCCRS